MNIDPSIMTSLARDYGAGPATRALMLVYAGAVQAERITREDGLLVVEAVVDDGGSALQVLLQIDEIDGDLIGHFCTRHATLTCQHTLAVLIASDLRPEALDVASVPSWQRTLESVMPTAQHRRHRELALFMTMVGPGGSRNRWGHGRQRYLGLRPAVRGARGRWIKGDVEWHGLTDRDAEREVIDLFDELVGLHELKQAQHGYWNPEWLPVDTLASRGLWQVLTELREAGVEIVSAGKQQNPVLFESESGQARVAVEEQEGGLQVSAELLVGAEVIDPGSVYPVGDPAVAIAQVAEPGGAGEQTTLTRLETPISRALWTLLREPDPVLVDAGSRAAFEADYLPRLRTLAPVISPAGSYTVPAPPRLTLELEVQATDEHVLLDWSWTGTPSGRPRAATREREILTQVSDAVGERADLVEIPPSGRERFESALVGSGAVLFLAEVLPRLRKIDGVRVHESEGTPSYRATAGGPVVTVEARPSETDWFDLHVEVEVDGEKVPFGRVFVALAKGEEIFVLPDGRYFSLTGPEMSQLRAIIDEARQLSDRPVESLRISRYQVDLWAELVELGVVRAQEQAWLSSARGLGEQAVEPVPVPAGVNAELRGYQREGLSWLHFLRRNGLGGILADDMGLGKTLQAIAMIEAAREENPDMAPVVVVAPTSVVGNWVAECARFAPGLSVVAVEATEGRRGVPLAEAVAGAHVVVTSYTLLRLEEEAYRVLPWSGAIFDEAQMIKNHRSRGYRSARLLPAPSKLAITGTPLENNLTELWALSALVCPGLLGGERQFADLYRVPIEKDRDAERLSRLQRRLRPFLLRRRKEEVAAELPPKQEQVRELELHPRHRKIYDLRLQRERQKILGLLEDMDANRFQVFRSLTLLRQLALDADLVDDSEGREDGLPPSAKLEALAELLKEVAAEGHRVLVFSTFTRFLAKARDRAAAAGLGTAYLDGSTRHRQAEIDRFRGGDAPVFFVSLKAGGFGLNLTEADYVVLLDPWWNPAAEAQAVDRTHRIGQTRPVMVYRFVSAGTIEAKVLSLSARKAKLFADVLDGGAAESGGHLTAEEIRGLVS